VPPQRVWFLSHFGLKTGIDFDGTFWSEIGGVWLSGERSRKLINLSFFSATGRVTDEKEREIDKIYHSS